MNKHRRRSLARLQGISCNNKPQREPLLNPPLPPVLLTPQIACDPTTDPQILWHIARNAAHLRKWIVANSAASPELLEYIAQVSGPQVPQALTALLNCLEQNHE